MGSNFNHSNWLPSGNSKANETHPLAVGARKARPDKPQQPVVGHWLAAVHDRVRAGYQLVQVHGHPMTRKVPLGHGQVRSRRPIQAAQRVDVLRRELANTTLAAVKQSGQSLPISLARFIELGDSHLSNLQAQIILALGKE